MHHPGRHHELGALGERVAADLDRGQRLARRSPRRADRGASTRARRPRSRRACPGRRARGCVRRARARARRPGAPALRDASPAGTASRSAPAPSSRARPGTAITASSRTCASVICAAALVARANQQRQQIVARARWLRLRASMMPQDQGVDACAGRAQPAVGGRRHPGGRLEARRQAEHPAELLHQLADDAGRCRPRRPTGRRRTASRRRCSASPPSCPRARRASRRLASRPWRARSRRPSAPRTTAAAGGETPAAPAGAAAATTRPR